MTGLTSSSNEVSFLNKFVTSVVIGFKGNDAKVHLCWSYMIDILMIVAKAVFYGKPINKKNAKISGEFA